MASADGKSIFAGLTTGSIMVWTLNGINGVSSGLSPKLTRLTPKRVLDGHTDVVTALAVCPTHNFIVSASRDKTAIVWHLTKLIYIRQLKGHSGAVSAVAVNEATGDVATASGSCIFLWTINGSLLSVVNSIDSGLFSNPSSLVLCLSFSTVNEWDSKNVVMCGTSDGLVKMYSCEFKKVVAAPTNESEQAVASKKSLGQNQIQDPKALKEHLLRRQQRIQHHTRRSPLEQISQDSSQASSPVHIPYSITTTTTIQPTSMSNDNKNEIVEYRRQLTLRRVLSEHTAFNQDNPHPAPITSLSPSKDHKSVYVGDGVGRIWVWSNDQSNNSTNNSSATMAALTKR
jgi:WD40 repeat protein